MKKELIILLLGFLSFCYVQSQPLPQITFTPQWLPQAQFAGYYVAQNKGFYRSEGLAVRIVHPSVSVNAVESLINGQSDIISLFLTTALSFKDLGVDLVNMGQISQNSALLFVFI